MHHAYLYTQESAISVVDDGSVMWTRHVYDTLRIADVRQLIEDSARKPADSYATQAFVLVVDTMRIESQNALLKLFEEPPSGVVFHLVVRDCVGLLPTLRSRLEDRTSAETQDTSAIARDFFALPIADRLACVAEKVTSKDIIWQQALITGTETCVVQGNLPKHLSKTVVYVSGRLRAPGASPKLLLEHLALAL